MISEQLSLPKLSLILNILVLVPVCLSLVLKLNWVIDAYGSESPARSILLSIYIAIFIFSAALLFKFDEKIVMALLSVQVVYKFLSPITLGSLTNPVIISNLMIASFHSYVIFNLASNRG